MKTGVIFDIKELSIFDGPGLRQTIFLKGCPLRCNWCHNPEGLSIRPQIISSNVTCTYCNEEQIVWEKNICNKCGKILPILPKTVGEELTSDELIKRIKVNSSYYEEYGGGVTFSGGEPLMQADFLVEVLEGVEGIHRAIETSAYCRNDDFKKVMANVDFFMIDFKISDEDLHKKHTGVSNRLIIENIKTVCNGNKPFVIRIPLIPGVNDNDEHFINVANIIKDAKYLQKVELLPYHQTAGAKYKSIGKEYNPKFNVKSEINRSTTIFESYGIRSEIL